MLTGSFIRRQSRHSLDLKNPVMKLFKKKKVNNAPVREDLPFDQLKEGVDYTMNNGLLVFTAQYLKKRGYCCENKCLNCPYGIHDRK